MEVKDLIALIAAILALVLTTAQWLQSQREDRIKLLLGEKETAGFQALKIARHPQVRVSDDMLRALILVTIFEASDRARMQIYRALDALKTRHEARIVGFRAEIVDAARRYGDAVDVRSFNLRLGQLDTALPWIARNSA